MLAAGADRAGKPAIRPAQYLTGPGIGRKCTRTDLNG
jgi:hypothetical protein